LAGSGNPVVISASHSDEKSYEDEDSKHGYFTRFLLEALAQAPAPQSLSAVFTYLEAHVSSRVAQIDGHQQHPVMQSFGEGRDIVLNGPVLAASKASPIEFLSPSTPARH
jgi:hypothetical protein